MFRFQIISLSDNYLKALISNEIVFLLRKKTFHYKRWLWFLNKYTGLYRWFHELPKLTLFLKIMYCIYGYNSILTITHIVFLS